MTNEYRQCPRILVNRQIRPKKIEGGFVWAVCFELPSPAEEDGYIIQHIIQEESGAQVKNDIKTEAPYTRIQYWEAWEVKKGETEPRQTQTVNSFLSDTLKRSPISDPDYNLPMNDVFYKQYSIGSVGNYGIWGLAGFYHGALTADFIVGRKGAGALRSTPERPKFWTNNGWLRSVNLGFRCETAARRKDDSIQSFNADRGRKVEVGFADKWINTISDALLKPPPEPQNAIK